QAGEKAQLIDPRGFREVRRTFEVKHRRAFTANLRALVKRGQPAGSPIADAIHGQSTGVAKHDIRGQVLALGTKPVKDPWAPGGASGLEFPAVNNAKGRFVV